MQAYIKSAARPPLQAVACRLRLCVAATLLALILCACAVGSELPRGTTVTTIPGFADTALPKRITFAVGADAPEYLMLAAEGFCRRANSISSGIFTVSLIKSTYPLDDFRNGGADMILLDGKSAEEIHKFFAIANEPFRYQSYENFAITCNYTQVLQRLSEASDAKVFAAYYTGSNIFAGYSPLDDALNIRRGAEPEEEGEIKITAAPGSGGWLRQNFPDVSVTEPKDPAERILTISEDTLAELPAGSAVATALAALVTESERDGDSELVVTRSFHSIEPTWLILAPSLYEGLPPLAQAAIDEAAAFMTGDIDGVYLEHERQFFDAMTDASIGISSGFTASRARIFRTESARLTDLSEDEREFRELLSRFR